MGVPRICPHNPQTGTTPAVGVAVESVVGGALVAGGLGGPGSAAARQFAGQPYMSHGAPSGEKAAA